MLQLLVRRASSMMARAEAAPAAPAAAASNKIIFSLFTPHATIRRKVEADLVVVPGAGGVFGVAAQHVPTIAELQPGLVAVYENGDTNSPASKYFVAGGFCMVKEDSSCDISATEAVLLSDLDHDAVRKALSSAKDTLATAQSDEDRAKAQVAVDVFEAMESALA